MKYQICEGKGIIGYNIRKIRKFLFKLYAEKYKKKSQKSVKKYLHFMPDVLIYLGVKFSRYSGLGHSDRFLIFGGY